jgi:biopolymer transport protein ExbD
MRAVHHRSSNPSGIDAKMTPMIDTIFLLQIFFLCTTGFEKRETLLPAELPKTGVAEAASLEQPAPLDMVRIRLIGAGNEFQIELNQRPLANMADLVEQLGRLREAARELAVILDVDPNISLGAVVRVYDECLANGFSRVNFAAAKAK